MKLNLLSLFSGIGAFEKALDTLNVPYKLVNYCEIDKYASKSYAAIHGVSEDLNLGDITKVDTSKLHDIDVVTYGFPCQDISSAGRQKGFEDNGERTRSGLFFEALRIIEDTKPKVAICENVKNLVGKKFTKEFDIVLSSLKDAGYNNYWKVLNAKDYGVPQNRERVFVVSIRKDVDTGTFKFPEPIELKLRLKDMLEDEVDEKYYLSEKMMQYIVADNEKWKGNNDKAIINKSIASTINTSEGSRRCDASNYISKDIDAEDVDVKKRLIQVGQSGLIQPLDRKYKEHNSKREEHIEFKDDNCSHALRTSVIPVTVVKMIKETRVIGENMEQLRIRKLTPKECFRLMGFTDEDFEKAEKVNSNTQLYKQAGNSIVVNVLTHLFKEIIESGVLDVKKVEEVKTITFECNDLINVAALRENEPELYAELLKDYPCENATYIFKNKVVA